MSRTTMLQNIFFGLVHQLLPTVFEDLEYRVYPAFKLHPCRLDSEWRYSHAMDVKDPEHLPELFNWARDYNLTSVPWFLHGVVNTLHLWETLEVHEGPGFRRHVAGISSTGAYSLISEEDARNIVELFPWMPDEYEWEAAEAEMDKVYKQHKEAYRARIEHLAHAAGGVRGETRRAPEHLEWLAWYQVQGLSREEIAEKLEKQREHLPPDDAAKTPSPSAVGKALKDWAALIDLPLRKQRTRRRRPSAIR